MIEVTQGKRWMFEAVCQTCMLVRGNTRILPQRKFRSRWQCFKPDKFILVSSMGMFSKGLEAFSSAVSS